MTTKMKFVVRDVECPVKPYNGSTHNFFVSVMHPDGTYYKGMALTDAGPQGGKIAGEMEVYTGTYVVFAWAACKNVVTNSLIVTVPCNKDVCVNLLPRTYGECSFQTALADFCAMFNTDYPFSSRAVSTKRMREDLGNLQRSREAVLKHLPKFVPPFSSKELERLGAPDELVNAWMKLEG